jgi:hypothetical protein
MKRAVRYAIWIVLFLVSIEAAVRVDDWITYGAAPLGNFNQESLYTYDALGKRGKPHGQYLKWKLNALGFRGPELRQGTVRVAVVGSSETFGLYESPDHEWPRELESALNAIPGNQPVEVVNFAFPGMLLSTFERRLVEFTAAVEPKVVLIYPSPSGYLYRESAEKPQVVPTPQPPELRIRSRAETVFKNNAPQGLLNWLRDRQARRIFAATAEVYDRAPAEVLGSFKADLQQVLRELRARDIVPVLITHATYFGARLDRDELPMLTAWRKFYPMLKEDGFLDLENRANEILRALAREQNLPLTDAAVLIPEGPENFADFVHFTDHGVKIFTGLIAAQLACLRSHPARCVEGEEKLRLSTVK